MKSTRLKGSFFVAPARHADVRALVIAWHKAGGASNTSVAAHAMFDVQTLEIVAGCLWMLPLPGAARKAAEVMGCKASEVLSLSRLVCHPNAPRNAASFLLGRSIRELGSTPYRVGVTFSDRAWGHTGGIYRATNWIDGGEPPPRKLWIDDTGRRVAQKSKRNRTAEEMRALGYRQEASQLRRFYCRFPPRRRHQAKIERCEQMALF